MSLLKRIAQALQPQRLVRGLANMMPEDGWPREVAERLVAGSATIEDIALCVNFRSLGLNWWREGEENSTHESNVQQAYVYGYTEDPLTTELQQEDASAKVIYGVIGLILVAEVQKKIPENDWSGEIPPRTKLTIKQIQYNAGNGWVTLSVNIPGKP